MTQRINITYSIKLENLEAEVSRLLHITLDKLEEASSSHFPLEEERELLNTKTFKDIDVLRQELAEIDAGFRDVSNLIASYLDYEVQSLSKEQEQETLSEPARSPLADLNEKLAHFKEWAHLPSESESSPNEIPD